MATVKYSVNQHPVQTVLTWIRSGEVAVPEIQGRGLIAGKIREYYRAL